MHRECFSYRNMNPIYDYPGMRVLMKTGIFVLLISSVFGRALHEERKTEINTTNYNEEPLENNCNCEWRYYKHYEAKGCQVMQVDSCGCPKKYLCFLSSDASKEQKVCIYQNQEYKLGSRINVSDKCQSCRCLGGEEPQIICRYKECPQLEQVEDKNCHLVYEKDQCCPSKYECVLSTNENEAIETGSFCVHDRVTYPLGAKIYPTDDPCLICECSETWRGISNSSCYQQDCLFEKNKKRFDAGCVPVYHKNKCCPIEFHCPESISSNNVTSKSDLIAEDSESSDNYCKFAGKSYEIGSEMLMKNPCIKCNCLVPPDFTCVHQSCPPSPSIEKCEVMYSTNSCCPSYQCLNDDMPDAQADNTSTIDCPTPQCADATCVIKIPEGHQCPTCVCDEPTTHEKNMLESDEELIMEGGLKNGSFPEEEEITNENFDAEILNPIDMEFTTENKNMSEKFVDESSEKEHIEYDEIEKLEHEVDMGVNIFEKEQEAFENNEDSSREELEFISNESSLASNTTDDERNSIKNLMKRSTDFRNNNNALSQAQQQNSVPYNQLTQTQQHFFEEEEPESDREILEGGDDGFDELSFSSRSRSEEKGEGNIDNEDLISSESVLVPPGCPTPLCANSSCKIQIPVGHQCPTCVCKNRDVWQPR